MAIAISAEAALAIASGFLPIMRSSFCVTPHHINVWGIQASDNLPHPGPNCTVSYRHQMVNRMRQISTLLIILAVATLAVAAAAQPAKLDLNAIGAMPGTEIRKEKSSTGEDIVIIARGGVEITVDGNRSIGIDRSGHGAVLCVWQIYAHVKIVLDSCYPGEQQELRDDINSALDAINDFIVANSLTPVKKSNLEAQLIKMGDDFQLPQSGLARKCSIERSGGLVRAVIAMPREKRKAQLDDLLSLPRPPVLNPCL